MMPPDEFAGPAAVPTRNDSHPGSRPPADVFLTATEVIARYGWGRTKGYRVLRSAGFPRPIGGDRYRLDALLRWENDQLSAPLSERSTPRLPARKRRISAVS